MPKDPEEKENPFDIMMLTHGRLDLTIKALNALYAHTTTPFQLIIIDDSDPNDPDPSTSLTVPYLEKFQKLHNNITLLHSKKPYTDSSRALNVGLKEAKHDFVAFLSNSVTVEPAWEKVALRFMAEHPDVGIVGLKCLELAGGIIESAGIVFEGIFPIDRGKGNPSHRLTSISEVPAVQWALVILRKEAIGILEENIYHPWRGWEDIDYCLVARKKGWKVYYCGYGAGFHETKATRGSDAQKAHRLNQENGEIFYKRWDMWDEYQEIIGTNKAVISDSTRVTEKIKEEEDARSYTQE